MTNNGKDGSGGGSERRRQIEVEGNGRCEDKKGRGREFPAADQVRDAWEVAREVGEMKMQKKLEEQARVEEKQEEKDERMREETEKETHKTNEARDCGGREGAKRIHVRWEGIRARQRARQGA